MTTPRYLLWAVGTVVAGAVAWAWTGGLEPFVVAFVSLVLGLVIIRPSLEQTDALAKNLEQGQDLLLGDWTGAPARIAEQFTRVDERRRDVEAEVARVNARFDELLESAPAGIMLVDGDGRITTCNQRLVAMLEPRLSPMGRLPVEAFSLVELHEIVQEILAGVEPAPRECASGDLDVALEGSALREGGMVVVRDVSRFRRAERARTDFVANVSHELRTPVAAIMGYAEALLEESERMPEDLAPMAEVIHRNGRRVSRLFDDLLELHRIEARRRQLPREEFRLQPVLAAAVESAADRAAMKHQEFSLYCDGALTAETNREALSAIVANLVSNACKYTPEGGQIVVRAVGTETGVRIDVRDSGVGISKAHQERIFERFYRVDEGRSRMAGGAGLGLAIVKHLAMASACEITVQSDEGTGSVFSVHLEPPMESTEDVARTWDATL